MTDPHALEPCPFCANIPTTAPGRTFSRVVHYCPVAGPMAMTVERWNRRAHPAPSEPRWAPIATAPKDGHRILMTGLNQAVRWTCIGFYSPAYGATWVSEETTSPHPAKVQGPTHWQPLPEPPTDD